MLQIWICVYCPEIFELPMSPKTLEMAHKLKETGFTPPQAECIVEQVMVAIQDSDLVTKTFLTVELAKLEARLEKKTDDGFSRLERKISRLEIRWTRLEIRWIKWMIGIQLCFFTFTMASILGLIYFLHSK